LSRHRKIRLGRSKAIVIAAAGALSVATAASAAAATWSPGTQGRAGGPDGPAEAAAREGSTTLVQHAFQLRLTQARDAIARRQAAKKRAAGPAAARSPQRIAAAMLGSFGWSSGQFSCLDPLWEHESGWSATSANPGSGAYGIPQALPGSRMASAGPDWQANAATQIRWGLGYIKGTYGSPCAAWAHEQATGWY
jgi:hypothetical protein